MAPVPEHFEVTTYLIEYEKKIMCPYLKEYISIVD
jgi:hypothetical protein